MQTGKLPKRAIVYLVVAIAVFYSVWRLYLHMGLGNIAGIDVDSLERKALAGDSFGMVNALFSGLAFAGVVLALFVQTLEFHLAERERKEGLLTQEEISRQQYFSSLASTVTALETNPRSWDRKVTQTPQVLTEYLSWREQRAALQATISTLIRDDRYRKYFHSSAISVLDWTVKATDRCRSLLEAQESLSTAACTVLNYGLDNKCAIQPADGIPKEFALAAIEKFKNLRAADVPDEAVEYPENVGAQELNNVYDSIIHRLEEALQEPAARPLLSEEYEQLNRKLSDVTQYVISLVLFYAPKGDSTEE